MGALYSNNQIQNSPFKCDVDEYFNLIAQQIQKLTNEKLFSLQCKKKQSQEQTIFQSSNPVYNPLNQIHCKTFILQYLAFEYEQGKLWVADLYRLISREIFYTEKRWLNLFFWQEFEKRTKPKCLVRKCKRMFYPQSDYFTYEVENNNNTDATTEYKVYKEKVYTYMRILKEHIMNEDHPINFIIKHFVIKFSAYVKENIDTLVDMKVHNPEQFNSECNSIVNDIISQLQSFIMKTEECLAKLYNNTLNFQILVQEEDEFINLISGLIFDQGDLSKYITQLITLTLFNEIAEFKAILTIKANIYPEELNIPDKFCLNNSSLSFFENTYKSKYPRAEILDQPYLDTIELLKSITLYKKPLDKLLLINKLSRSISECINKFWSAVDKTIPPNSLGIEGDDLMNILSYIVIKSQMSELIAQMKFIELFTSTKTRSNMIGYYYSTLEVSILQLNSMKDIDKSNETSLYRDCEALLNSSN